jgi:uncharacterized iron-regulated membrane protein
MCVIYIFSRVSGVVILTLSPLQIRDAFRRFDHDDSKQLDTQEFKLMLGTSCGIFFNALG